MSEKVTLNMDEIKRGYVLEAVIEHKLSGREAAERLGLSVRQVRRLIGKYRRGGAAGLAHGNRGRAPRNRVEAEVRQKVQRLSEEAYRDYNDSHFTEELADEHGLVLSRSTVRRIRREAGQKSPRKRRGRIRRNRRQRREAAGMLLQADGSRHDWLEGRGPYLTLIGYIDDATGEVCGALFRAEEDAAGYFEGLRHICQSQGLPVAIYADRHTIFQSPTRADTARHLADEPPRTQYGRLLDELGIELIAARSPQAKGRVERLWGTLQDRLVKALRKAGASTLEQANQVLDRFLPLFNQRFAVQPAQPESAYLPWPQHAKLEDFFCFKHTRTVANDHTLRFDGQLLQLPPASPIPNLARKRVDVRQHLDGRLEVLYHDQSLAIFQPEGTAPLRMLKFSPAPGQTAPPPDPHQPAPTTPRNTFIPKPAPNHPWRRFSPKPIEPPPIRKDEPGRDSCSGSPSEGSSLLYLPSTGCEDDTFPDHLG
jgi:transposase